MEALFAAGQLLADYSSVVTDISDVTASGYGATLSVSDDSYVGDVVLTIEILPPPADLGTPCGDDVGRCYEPGASNVYTLTIVDTD